MIRTERGFTLIELLVVISIVGMLSSVIMASLNSARNKGKDAQRVLILKEFAKANEFRYDNAQTYAPTRGFLSNTNALSGINTDLSPYINAVIDTSELGRYLYMRKEYVESSATSFGQCLITGGWTANSSKYAFYVRLDNPQTTSSNYISASIGGDAYDRCVASLYNVNYRVGN